MSQPRGRPRGTGADERILTATLQGLASVGYDELSVDDVAAAAGVAKTTLYRRWPTKAELVLRCLQERVIRQSPPPTGDWRKDIRCTLEAIAHEVATPEGEAWNSVFAAAHNNRELSLDFSRDDEPVVRIRDALLEGVRRGELRADLDVDLAMDLITAVIIFRTFVLRESVDPGIADSIIEMVLDGASATSQVSAER